MRKGLICLAMLLCCAAQADEGGVPDGGMVPDAGLPEKLVFVTPDSKCYPGAQGVEALRQQQARARSALAAVQMEIENLRARFGYQDDFAKSRLRSAETYLASFPPKIEAARSATRACLKIEADEQDRIRGEEKGTAFAREADRAYLIEKARTQAAKEEKEAAVEQRRAAEAQRTAALARSSAANATKAAREARRSTFSDFRMCMREAGVPMKNPTRLPVGEGAVYAGIFPIAKGAYSIRSDASERIVGGQVILADDDTDHLRALGAVFVAMSICMTGAPVPVGDLISNGSVTTSRAQYTKKSTDGGGAVLAVDMK